MDSQRDDFIWAVIVLNRRDVLPPHETAVRIQSFTPHAICSAAKAFSWRDPRRQKLRRGLRWATSVTTEEVEQAIKEARQ